jgi:hypothetical protein
MIQLETDPPFLASECALAEFIRRFERGTLPKPLWTHAAHIGIAAWYLLALPEAEATVRVRDGIKRYNEAVGTANTEDSGYHETLTLFWLRTISGRLSRPDRPAETLDAIRMVVAEFGQRRDLYRNFYSFDVVKSRQARAKWVPPDAAGKPREQE